MSLSRLKEALTGRRDDHPERTYATLERLLEVLDNVLGDRASEMSGAVRQAAGETGLRDPLGNTAIEALVDVLDGSGINREELSRITEQLMDSEISTAEAIELHRRYKIPVSHLESDIIPVRGDGCWIMDTKGRWYLDMDSNYSATNLGMDNEEIARGLYNQARRLISMKEDRVHIARARFLKEIHGMMPEGLDRFYWQNSGGEAVDKALKIAKAHTGTTGVIAFKGGFHGRTHGAVSVTWNEDYRRPFGLHEQDWAHFADFNDIAGVRKLMDETGARIVLLEMVQGEDAGNRPADQGFVDELWALVKERGGVIIDDEVQAGFGRTATREGEWFSCMGYGVVPDIMVIGKSFGGGYPVTAVVTTAEVSDSMKGGYDGSTFGGNPMAMTSALIATRQMREMDLTRNVVERGEQLMKGLEELKGKHSVIGMVRGRGLMIGFSVGSPENVEKLQKGLSKRGVKSSLSTGDVFRILPPTIITSGEVDTFLDRLDGALSELA